ncbi:MAG: redoxin domain-containing protein, partial [Gammaproteobacteria bacterium]
MTVSRTALVITAFVSACAGGGIAYLGLRGASTGSADVSTPPVRDFALLDQDGRFHQLHRLTKAKAVVLFIHGLGCTTVRDSLPALKALRDTYAKQGVEFMLINANPQDDRKALQAEAARLHLHLPILKDEAQLVIQSLHAERTGEAILIDTQTWAIRYRGPIDDRMQYGSQRPAATRHYLDDALAAVLDKETVPVRQAPVFGCVLNIEPRRPLSYASDVVPILRDRCINCHRAGGVGPWAMDRYETVRAWSQMMREVIMTKRMPPWQADPAVGEFLADGALRTEEQKTLVGWIDAGAPRGDGPDPLAAQPPE